MKNRRRLLTLILGLLNAGCTINSVQLLPSGGMPAPHRAVIVYGVQVEGAWPYAGFQVEMAEYDIEKQNIRGNCFRFNRAEARVSPPVPGAVRYFAFDAPPGHYVYSPFNGARLAGDVLAFHAPAGKSVYLGNFRLEKTGQVSLTRSLEAVRNEIDTALPGLKGQVSLARAALAKRPTPFLCTP